MGGPYNKGYSILGSILGLLFFWKLACGSFIRQKVPGVKPMILKCLLGGRREYEYTIWGLHRGCIHSYPARLCVLVAHAWQQDPSTLDLARGHLEGPLPPATAGMMYRDPDRNTANENKSRV